MNDQNPEDVAKPAAPAAQPEVEGRASYERRSIQCKVCGGISEMYAARSDIGRCPICNADIRPAD